ELAPMTGASQQGAFLRALDDAELGIVLGMNGAAHLARFALQAIRQLAIAGPERPAVGIGAIELHRHQAGRSRLQRTGSQDRRLRLRWPLAAILRLQSAR